MLTKEELQKQLDEAKTNIENAATQKAKEAFAVEVKALTDQMKAMDLKKVNDDLAIVNTTVTDVKKTVDEMKAAAVIKDADDKKNQTLIDNMASDLKLVKGNTSPVSEKSFEDHFKDALTDGENFKNLENMATNAKDRNKKFTIELKAAAGDVLINTNYSGGTRGLSVLKPGIITVPNRRTHIRSIVPGGTIGQGTSLVFMKEDVGNGVISPVAEGSMKQQIDEALVEASVNIETIAGWLRVTRKAMNNIPGFISFLQMRLPQRLLNIEDSQLLQGSGVTPNIKGIMTSGNYTAATTAENLLIEQLIDGLAQLEDSYERVATAILLRPLEYYRFFKTKSGGSKEYDLPKNVVFSGDTLYISGVPVYQSTAVPAGKYIIGDFAEGCQLLTQEGIRVEFFEQDGTNVRENKITVRIEETIAFPVFGSTYFVVGDVGNASLTS